MSTRHFAVLALASSILACSAGRNESPVRVSPEGPDQQWQADLTTPQRLTGALQISGRAWMRADTAVEGTQVGLEIRNAAPGGVHPWGIFGGRCGDSERRSLGDEGRYEPVRVKDNGTGSTTTQVPMTPDRYNSYHIAVYASPQNRDLVVACGNFAPPVDR